MNKAELLATIRAERAHWDDRLADIDERRMTEPGAAGQWSLKDVVAHIAAWERYMARRLEPVLRGETDIPPESTLDTDEDNARIYAAHRDEPLADVLAGARQAHQNLLGLVAALPESALAGTHWFATSGDPLWESIAGNTYEHYREHMPAAREDSGLRTQD